MSFKNLIRQHPLTRKLVNTLNPFNLSVPPGHFYSPVPDINEVKKNADKIFNSQKPVLGIDFNDAGQLSLLERFKKEYPKLPFTENADPRFRYRYNNEMYGHSSGALLFCIMQVLKPKRIIEVGSGYSSALMLDTNSLFFNNEISLTFVEPYPDRLKKLLRPEDYQRSIIVEKKVEAVDPSIFETLGENDILFIDSTHVSKIGSDVNTIVFDILPRLKKGVYVHFHDIIYPFEYPKEWVLNGVFWNESYLLRAFLQFNNSFSIQFFNTYALEKFPREHDALPLFNTNVGGCIWLKKEK